MSDRFAEMGGIPVNDDGGDEAKDIRGNALPPPEAVPDIERRKAEA